MISRLAQILKRTFNTPCFPEQFWSRSLNSVFFPVLHLFLLLCYHCSCRRHHHHHHHHYHRHRRPRATVPVGMKPKLLPLCQHPTCQHEGYSPPTARLSVAPLLRESPPLSTVWSHVLCWHRGCEPVLWRTCYSALDYRSLQLTFFFDSRSDQHERKSANNAGKLLFLETLC